MKKVAFSLLLLISSLFSNSETNLQKKDFSLSSIKYWNFNDIKSVNVTKNKDEIKKWISGKDNEYVVLDNIDISQSIHSIKGFFKEKCINKDSKKKICFLTSPTLYNNLYFKYYKNIILTESYEVQPLFVKLNKEKALLTLTINNKDEFSYIENTIKFFAKESAMNPKDIITVIDMNYKTLKKENEIFSNIDKINYINNDHILTNKQRVIINNGQYLVNELLFTLNKKSNLKDQIKIYKKEYGSYLPIEFKF